MREAGSRIRNKLPHELQFGSLGLGWGQAYKTTHGNYYTKLDLAKIEQSLTAGELGYPGEAALRADSSLSEGIIFVLGHEYVHHVWPTTTHGSLFNFRAGLLRNATRECK